MDKYKELYDYSLNAFSNGKNRFYKIDSKASIYLSALTLSLTIFGYFGKWILENIIPPNAIIDWIILFVFIVSFFSAVLAWYFNFKVLKLQDVMVTPLNNEIIEFYHLNELVDIYYAMSKRIKEAYIKNDAVINNKVEYLKKGYLAISILIFSLVLISILFTIKSLDNKTKNRKSLYGTKKKY